MRSFVNGMKDPTKLWRASGNPTEGSRRFHPVYVAIGTVTRGDRMPEISLPSAPTCGTSAGYVPKTLGGSLVRSILYGSYGVTGNFTTISVARTNVPSLMRG